MYAAVEKLVRDLFGLFQPLIRGLYPRFCRMWESGDPGIHKETMRVFLSIGAVLMVAVVGTLVLGDVVLQAMFGFSLAGSSDVLAALIPWLVFMVANAALGSLLIVPAGLRDGYANVLLTTTFAQVFFLCVGVSFMELKGLVAALVFSEALRTAALVIVAQRVLPRPFLQTRT